MTKKTISFTPYPRTQAISIGNFPRLNEGVQKFLISQKWPKITEVSPADPLTLRPASATHKRNKALEFSFSNSMDNVRVIKPIGDVLWW